MAETAPSEPATLPTTGDTKPAEKPVGDEPNRESAPETVNRAIRKMAEHAPEGFVEMTAMMGMMGHPLHQKMNEQHITRMLDLAVQHDTNEFSLKQGQQSIDSTHQNWERICHLVYFVLFLALVVFIIAMFATQPAVLVPILTGVGGVVTGFLGGVGYAKSKKSSGKK